MSAVHAAQQRYGLFYEQRNIVITLLYIIIPMEKLHPESNHFVPCISGGGSYKE